MQKEGLTEWLREQYIILARQTNTPVYYWENLPLRRLFDWIRAHNNVMKTKDR
ncbi:MAG: hypothetical protein LUE89_11395 [Clostridiales bacterium]|nr:hypothetical protein [Clostridiales bacterium]